MTTLDQNITDETFNETKLRRTGLGGNLGSVTMVDDSIGDSRDVGRPHPVETPTF